MIEKNSKILIIGASGFVGKNLVKKFKILGFNNLLTPSSKELNVLDFENVSEYFYENKPHSVIFLAAEYGGVNACKVNAPEYLSKNSYMALNVLNNAIKNNVHKFIYISSATIYPENSPQPIKEEYLLSGKLVPSVEGYALAKILGTKLTYMIGEKYGVPYFTLVPTNMYGPYDRFGDPNSNVVSSLIWKIHHAKVEDKPYVELFGTGTPKRDLLFVEDFVDAVIYFLLDYNGNEWINIGSNDEISIKELALLLKEIIGYKGEICFNKNYPDGAARRLLCIEKAKKLGWSPKINVYEGLEKTYKWFLNNIK